MSTVGTRVRVWWDGDDCWYHGVIASHRVGTARTPPRVGVSYDDGTKMTYGLGEIAREDDIGAVVGGKFMLTSDSGDASQVAWEVEATSTGAAPSDVVDVVRFTSRFVRW